MKLPFSNFFKKQQNLNESTANSFAQHNPNYNAFNTIDYDIASVINSSKSVISQNVEHYNSKFSSPVAWQTFSSNDMMAIPIASNKLERITQYRRMSKYPLCDWCLDEICDDFIHEDETHEFIKLKLPDRLTAEQNNIIQNEFKKYINLFDLKNNGYNLIKRFLIEGELAWENVIKPKYPKLGITAVRFLPAEYYETLVDIKTGEPVGIVFDVEKFSNDMRMTYSSSINNSAGIFNAISPMTYSYRISKDTSIPLLWNQVTYINSGEYSYDYMTTYPLIEKARSQYARLALIEDAAVILRVTHAPERLLFNISTGKLPLPQAEEYVRRFAMELKSKKVASANGDDVFGVYQQPTMLKSWVFSKGDGNDGTSVESVGSSASYDEMGDIEYFVRWFLKTMKIPFSRYKTPENTVEKNEQMSYEEYSFSRMLMRFQKRFADGFKRGFITHLRLRELMNKEDYNLRESDIDVEFVKPVLYDMYEIQKLVDVKMSIYKSFKDNDEISKIMVMKKFLGWTDDDIKQNFEMLIKEKQLIAIGDYFAEQITAENPPVDFKSPIRLKSDVEAEQKISSTSSEATIDTENNDESGTEEQDETGNEEQPEEKPDMKQAETPSFGLG